MPQERKYMSAMAAAGEATAIIVVFMLAVMFLAWAFNVAYVPDMSPAHLPFGCEQMGECP